MNVWYTLKVIQGSMLILCRMIRISRRGEIQNKLSTSSTISCPVRGCDVSTFNCLTLYDDGDGRESLNFLSITKSFLKKFWLQQHMWINDVQKWRERENISNERKQNYLGWGTCQSQLFGFTQLCQKFNLFNIPRSNVQWWL